MPRLEVIAVLQTTVFIFPKFYQNVGGRKATHFLGSYSHLDEHNVFGCVRWAVLWFISCEAIFPAIDERKGGVSDLPGRGGKGSHPLLWDARKVPFTYSSGQCLLDIRKHLKK